jgi:hypothetical protein
MDQIYCFSCQKSKATLLCGICKDSICKSCVQFIEEDQFSFSSQVSQELKSSTFCQSCYNSRVVDEIEKYDELMKKAKAVDVFHKKQSKETRLIKRKEKPLSVVDCADFEEALLRLAFLAAEKGFSKIIDVDLQSKKVTINKYHTTVWSGTAIPVKD